MSYTDRIIQYCIENRVSTAEVADALGKDGVIPKVSPIGAGQHKVGRVRTIFTANKSNFALHEQIRDVQKGEIAVVFTHACDGRAILGGLVAKFVLLYKRASAIVVQGLVRDAAELRRQDYSVWAEGVSPLGCFNVPAEPYPEELEKEIRKLYDGGIAVCDDGGVTIIPKQKANGEMLERLRRIEMQEDIWFYCLDTLKWDTKKIVCDKAYLTESSLLSAVHIERLDELSSSLDSEQ